MKKMGITTECVGNGGCSAEPLSTLNSTIIRADAPACVGKVKSMREPVLKLRACELSLVDFTVGNYDRTLTWKWSWHLRPLATNVRNTQQN